MRVIAGKARRLNLKTIPGNETRPTTDRIKETLFNILQPEIPGCRFLDLFSGSGAIGIEALSRGAEYAVFVEKNPKACTCIRENLSFTKLTDGGKLLNMDVLQALRSLEGGEPFDCIFIDAAKAQYIRFFEKYCPLLSDNGIIITDNMEFHGLVKHPENTKNRNTRQLVLKIQKYHDYLEQLADYQTEFYSIGDGIALTRRKS